MQPNTPTADAAITLPTPDGTRAYRSAGSLTTRQLMAIRGQVLEGNVRFLTHGDTDRLKSGTRGPWSYLYEDETGRVHAATLAPDGRVIAHGTSR